MSSARARPLEGIRILDFTSMIAGPYCSRLLSDCGAEVIKVEEPGGDYMRSGRPVRNGHSAYFASLNCGKKSLIIDLKTPAGRAIALDLAAASDVVLENYRPGVMKRLGLDYSTLVGRNPALVYCALSGFGQQGPRANQPAYAPVIHAASGYDQTQYNYQGAKGKPLKTGIFVADVLAAVYAFGAIQTGVIGRLRHNKGQFIDVSLMDSMINLLVYECQEAQFPDDRTRPLYVPLATTDGFVMIAVINSRNFENVIQAIGRPDLANDIRFAKSENRRANWDEFMSIIEKWTSVRTSREAEATLMSEGVPCSRYVTVAEAIVDPQAVARGTMGAVEDGAGTLLVPNPPFKFSDGTVAVGSKVPLPGEHSREILREILGMNLSRIEELTASRVIQSSEHVK